MPSTEISQQQRPVSLLTPIPNQNEISKPQAMSTQADLANGNAQSASHSPESRPVELHGPIPEEEDEDETSSETANEPVTPTDFHNNSQNAPPHQLDGSHSPFTRSNGKVPALLNTAATPPSSAGDSTSAEATNTEGGPKEPAAASPSKEHGGKIKRGLSALFRRSNSHNQAPPPPPPEQTNAPPSNFAPTFNDDIPSAADHAFEMASPPRIQRFSISMGRRASTNNTPHYTPATTRSNSPPSPDNAGTPNHSQTSLREPASEDMFGHKKARSSTGLTSFIRGRKVAFTPNGSERPPGPTRVRSGSTELPRSNGMPSVDQKASFNPSVGHANPWALAAASGAGLKARRLSLSLPDDFTVDTVNLYVDYDNVSKVPGRRGKFLGNGATSQVTTMTRKGSGSELYAVKEFRGKSPRETQEEYEKKVKSEFSISKSLHHPNIVETFRLCTDHGRFNHVMEFCDGGDLFHLVSAGYLKGPQRADDRLCIFKQLVQGVHYLHSNGIAHRDIKLENLLLSNQCKLKITDFGVSEVFSGIHPGLRAAGGQCGREMGEVRLSDPGVCGSAPYIAPEVLPAKEPYDPRLVDVWSSAVVMIYLIFGGNIWEKAEMGKGHVNYEDLVRGWEKWNAKHEPGDETTELDYPHVKAFDQVVNPPALRRMLLNMFNPDPKRRTTIHKVASNRWFKNIECCQFDSYDDPTTLIDATKSCTHSKVTKVVRHNHSPPQAKLRNKLQNMGVRQPGSTEMDY